MIRFFFLILLNPFNFFFAQDAIDRSHIICKYETSFLKDTLDESTRSYELTVLLIGQHSSLFRSQVKHESDSLRNVIAQNAWANQSQAGDILSGLRKIPLPKYNPEVYKEGKVTKIYSRVFVDNYAFVSEKKIDWQILPETKIISTYKCIKAIGKYGHKTIIAWYAPDIPIPEGPYNFKGLPGLIIEAYDEGKHNHFVLKQLKKGEIEIKPETRRVLHTTYEKFLKKRSEFLNNPSGLLSAQVKPELRAAHMTKEKNDQYDARMRKENNYLD